MWARRRRHRAEEHPNEAPSRPATRRDVRAAARSLPGAARPPRSSGDSSWCGPSRTSSRSNFALVADGDRVPLRARSSGRGSRGSPCRLRGGRPRRADPVRVVGGGPGPRHEITIDVADAGRRALDRGAPVGARRQDVLDPHRDRVPLRSSAAWRRADGSTSRPTSEGGGPEGGQDWAMRVVVFSAKSYDRDELDRANDLGHHELDFLDVRLDEVTAASPRAGRVRVRERRRGRRRRWSAWPS